MATSKTVFAQSATHNPTSLNREIEFTIAVSDKSHQAVHGLTADDFTILIDGRPIKPNSIVENPSATTNVSAISRNTQEDKSTSIAETNKNGMTFNNSDQWKIQHDQTLIFVYDERFTPEYGADT